MNYKLIDNLSITDNHSKRLKELFDESDDVIITSPFLMPDFKDFFCKISLDGLNKIHLITTLIPKSFDQIKKINSLITLIELPNIKNKKTDCLISINNRLHGKIYIFKKQNHYISAIISSANFTDSGLSRNHEWGVEISDKEKIHELELSILNTIEFSHLSSGELYLMQEAANNFLDEQPQTNARDIELNLTEYLSNSWISQFDDNINYWLKPVGVTGYPVREDELFDTLEYRLHFSKQRPKQVKPNDILIAYGVGTSKVLSIYKATSYPARVTEEEIEEEEWVDRWPWYVDAQNLTQNYGKVWVKHILQINDLKDRYLKLHPNHSITAVGGKTLGGLNYGKDKLKLSPEFAKFIIYQVAEINNKG